MSNEDSVWQNVKRFFHGLGEIDHATSSKTLIPEIKSLARKVFLKKETPENEHEHSADHIRPEQYEDV